MADTVGMPAESLAHVIPAANPWRLEGEPGTPQKAAMRRTVDTALIHRDKQPPRNSRFLRATSVPTSSESVCLPAYVRRAGECPEWQRGRTVNPLAYAFVGSSPTSPTIAIRVVLQ
jgi:hypothetical protein